MSNERQPSGAMNFQFERHKKMATKLGLHDGVRVLNEMQTRFNQLVTDGKLVEIGREETNGLEFTPLQEAILNYLRFRSGEIVTRDEIMGKTGITSKKVFNKQMYRIRAGVAGDLAGSLHTIGYGKGTKGYRWLKSEEIT